MAKEKFDFSGWATRNDIKCSDGRTIRKNAFKHCDGQTVPLVWNHNHKDADNVLGHALLENRDEGVYSYCSFNDTEQGRNAKELVKHGDIVALSIYANQLKQNGGDVIHGAIKEVSLVLAGANPGAYIENVMIHGEDGDELEGSKIQFVGDNELEFDVEYEPVEHADEPVEHADEPSEKTVQEVFDEMTEEQKTVVYALIGAALEERDKEAESSAEPVEHADESSEQEENLEASNNQEEKEDMKHNAFEQVNTVVETDTLSHSELVGVIDIAKKTGSLKDAYNDAVKAKEGELAHSITDISVLFPEVKAIGTPTTINDNTDWVGKVMGGVKHTPFTRVKMMAFDITGENARARGYVKGNQKVEEVIAALRRETSPQTVYKLQKLDRDDIIDITDFDVVAYLKGEMREKLNEELARAILTGDGRSDASPDKINPLHIRPILGDNPTYVIAKFMEQANGEDDYKFAKRFIKEAIRARKEYKGKGKPALYCTEDIFTDMLLIEDRNERVIYDTEEKLKTALRVSDIVTVPYFESQTRTNDGYDYALMGIFVNLSDYNVGADKGGAVTMFDDFDINFNKYEYLIETRISGAMVQPYGAITFEKKSTHVEPEGE